MLQLTDKKYLHFTINLLFILTYGEILDGSSDVGPDKVCKIVNHELSDRIPLAILKLKNKYSLEKKAPLTLRK